MPNLSSNLLQTVVNLSWFFCSTWAWSLCEYQPRNTPAQFTEDDENIKHDDSLRRWNVLDDYILWSMKSHEPMLLRFLFLWAISLLSSAVVTFWLSFNVNYSKNKFIIFLENYQQSCQYRQSFFTFILHKQSLFHAKKHDIVTYNSIS